jgi:hypothetical protein
MAFAPIVIKNADLFLGSEADGTDYAIELTSIALTPDVSPERIKTAKPEGRFSSVDDPEWNLDLGYVYGKYGTGDTTVSLADYLMAHVGEQIEFTFRPKTQEAGYTGTVTLVPGAIGGDQGAFSNQSVSLPVEGQPTAVDAVAAG